MGVVQKWGNSLGVRVPKALAEQLGLHDGSEIEMVLRDGEIVISPVRRTYALADLLAAGLNANLGGRDHAPIEIERQVIGWAARQLGLPPETSGLLVTGSSLANLIGVLVARSAALGPAVRSAGLEGLLDHVISVDPMAWLTDVLERVVSGRTKAHELHTLLPWNWTAPSFRMAAPLAA